MELINQLEQFYKLESVVSTDNEEDILNILKKLTQIMKTNEEEENNRSKLTPRAFKTVESIIIESHSSKLMALLEESFRFLRNAVAFNKNNQNMIKEITTLLPWTGNFLEKQTNVNTNDQSMDMSIKLCFQFLINCIVDNETNAVIVSSFVPNYLHVYISRGLNEAGYLLNTILHLVPEFSSQFFKDKSIFQVILDNTHVDSNIILLENLSSNIEFLNMVYNELPQNQQIAYLEFLKHCKCDISIEFFSPLFQRKADSILKSNIEQLHTDFQEIVLLLELISSSSSSKQIELLSEDKPLVITAIHLLQLASKSDLLQPIEKLSQVTEEHQDHPGFLFKGNLIRLLGNVSHDHFENQSLIGSSCLEIILNCTRIDALNPFITQWSILAIRNLLHKHPRNQEMVSTLKLQSAVSSTVLKEFGVEVEVNAEDNKVHITSTKTKNNQIQ